MEIMQDSFTLKPHEDGSLCGSLPLYTKQPYELSNQTVLAQADGSFSVSRYAVAGLFSAFEPDSFYTALSVNEVAVPAGAPKEIAMLGRVQDIALRLSEMTIECSTFLDDATQAVFQQFTLHNGSGQPVAFGSDFGFLLSAECTQTAQGKPGFEADSLQVRKTQSGLVHSLPAGRQFALCCNLPLTLREVEGRGLHYSWRAAVGTGQAVVVKLAYALRETGGDNEMAHLLGTFDFTFAEARQYQQYLQEKLCGETPLQKALFSSALNCALSSYKQVGPFKGFYAGIHYRAPPRTYYRDGYFTVLPVLAHKPEWVREEICTLALGIAPDGTCPSAVIDAETFYWSNHLDSPAFFIMMVHDYLAATKDFGILEETIGGKTILQQVLFLTDALLQKADKNHLLWRETGNRHDWADNIYREGYVTYIEALFYRAIYCTSRILVATKMPDAERYMQQAETIRAAINEHLWNEKKGWYNNYKFEGGVEDNLSIDTVLCVLFGIANETRSRRMLQSMEALLESNNNSQQPFGDWGTLCCWPPYKYPAHLVEKSAYPYIYHNGSDWPYWSCAYAFAKSMHGLPQEYPLTRWFTHGLRQGWATPVEYYNPVSGHGSLLQGWSGMAAFTLYFAGQRQFPYEL
jgi:hypothetical protein